jgi:DegT/DnrJ/EryC1/StrS aminotransferase family
MEVPKGRVVTVSTGHAAPHLSLLLAGVGTGDQVITPSFNNVSDLQAILATGGEPVFCDIDPETASIDVAAAESAGAKLRVKSSEAGWVQFVDPAAKKSGWISLATLPKQNDIEENIIMDAPGFAFRFVIRGFLR